MGKTNIQWTDHTWNPVTGCTKVSEGCRNCWASSLHEMRHKALANGKKMPAQYAEPFTKVQCHEERLDEPMRIRKPSKIAVCLGGDLFHRDVPDLFIRKVMCVIAACPRHTFQILTKRPERMREFFAQFPDQKTAADGVSSPINVNGDIPDDWDLDEDFECYVHNSLSGALGVYGVGWPMKNLWIGTSVEDQKTADARIPLLLKVPAAVRWVSVEPLLGPIDLDSEKADGLHALGCGEASCTCGDRGLDWVVVGGESGPHARPMHPDWARSSRDQCSAAAVPFFFKQWGEWQPFSTTEGVQIPPFGDYSTEPNVHGGRTYYCNFLKAGKHAAGRLLDGKLWDEYPEAVEQLSKEPQ